jgi:tetratricopeptide (TPR) repeat protein
MATGREALALCLLTATAAAANNRAPSLTAMAQASTRPRECWPGAVVSKPNVWDRVRDPNLDRYCDLMARALGQLPRSPEDARAMATLADGVSPGHAGPPALRGRALAGLGAFDLAVREFERARQIDPRSLEDPETMRDWAASLAGAGAVKEALAVYRALAPRVELLSGADAQARVLLEAADVSFSFGPPALDDAIAFLREARRRSAADAAPLVAAELALALDRGAMTEQAASTAVEARQRIGENADVVAADRPGSEAAAAVALVFEPSDRPRAIRGWDSYLKREGGKGPWAQHARRHLEALKKQPGTPGHGR